MDWPTHLASGRLTHGYVYIALLTNQSIEMLMNSRDSYIKEMAVRLAALIADQLFFSDRSKL